MSNNKKSPSKDLVIAETKTEQKPKDKSVSKSAAKGKKPLKKQNRILKYFKDLKSEFKKVVWPSKQKVINNTTVVVVSMSVCGLVIWAIDTGLSQLLALVVKGK